jgi:methylated-DNA-protein-cysteine methyltransferase-like protein
MGNRSVELRIYTAVATIPSGRVATYGQIGMLAGLPRSGRLVGRTLKNLPDDSNLPWHRVINASGRISLPLDSESFKRQKARLQEEGLIVKGNRISLAQYQWQP